MSVKKDYSLNQNKYHCTLGQKRSRNNDTEVEAKGRKKVEGKINFVPEFSSSLCVYMLGVHIVLECLMWMFEQVKFVRGCMHTGKLEFLVSRSIPLACVHQSTLLKCYFVVEVRWYTWQNEVKSMCV